MMGNVVKPGDVTEGSPMGSYVSEPGINLNINFSLLGHL